MHGAQAASTLLRIGGLVGLLSTWQSYLILGKQLCTRAHWPLPPLAASMFMCIFLQIKWINKGLEQFDALYIVPVFQGECIGPIIKTA